MTDIVLATLNARYAHASLGLRCLRANLGELRERSVIREFIIGQKIEDIAEKILAEDLSVREAEEWVRKDRETPREVTAAEPATPRVTPLQPYYEAVAADLAAALGAETQIQSRGRKGRIVISFESLDELRRLKALLAPGSELARTA